MITLPFRGQPTREVLSHLTSAERLGYQVGALVNETPVGKWAASAYLTVFGQHWMRYFTHPICELVGLAHVPKDRSYILAANHRTYWDFFAVMCELWPHMPRGHKPYLYCPVRSTFFYDKHVGTFINLAVSAHAMYPPIFRDDRGGRLNDVAVRKCVDLLAFSPRSVIAIHPEGRRSQSPDPYAMLPARSGVGRIALAAHNTPVIPLFVNGLGEDLKTVLSARKTRDKGRLRMEFGPPVDLGDLYEKADDAAAHKLASERIMSHIAVLGENDRAARAGR